MPPAKREGQNSSIASPAPPSAVEVPLQPDRELCGAAEPAWRIALNLDLSSQQATDCAGGGGDSPVIHGIRVPYRPLGRLYIAVSRRNLRKNGMRLFCLPLAAGLAMTPSIRLCLDSPGGKLLGISGGVQRLHGVLPSWSGQESAPSHEYSAVPGAVGYEPRKVPILRKSGNRQEHPPWQDGGERQYWLEL